MASTEPTPEKSTPWGLIIGIIVIVAMVATFLLPILAPGVDTSETRGSIQTFAILAMGAIFAHQLKQAAEQRAAAAERQKKIEQKVENTEGKIEQLSVNVDGRLSQLLEHTELLNLAVGKAQGVEQERGRSEAAVVATGTPTVTTSTGEQGHIVDEEVLVKIQQKEG